MWLLDRALCEEFIDCVCNMIQYTCYLAWRKNILSLWMRNFISKLTDDVPFGELSLSDYVSILHVLKLSHKTSLGAEPPADRNLTVIAASPTRNSCSPANAYSG